MLADRLQRLTVSLVAAHSLVLGAALMLAPARVLALAGWPYDGPRFFPAQSGVLLLILGLGYLAGLRLRPFAWFLVVSKGIAAVFLAVAFFAGHAPPLALLQAALDGLMGLAVALLLRRAGGVTGRAA